MFISKNVRPQDLSMVLEDTTWEKCGYKSGQSIYDETESADYVYHVIEGAVRSCKMFADGRRQIGAFHLAGDIFGVESGPVYRFRTQAIVDTVVRRARRHRLEFVDVLAINRALKLTTANLQHAEEHLLLLGRKTSSERVAAFLLEMDRRLTEKGAIALPMTRRDIADYLGTTIETVSRALSTLHKEGVISFFEQDQRRIVIRDRDRLRELSAD
jgi:CRP/FNR family transcriptional regulator, nitrogen fixation regulation protein